MIKFIKLNCLANKDAEFWFDPEKIIAVIDVKSHRNIIFGHNDFFYSVSETVPEINNLLEKADA